MSAINSKLYKKHVIDCLTKFIIIAQNSNLHYVTLTALLFSLMQLFFELKT